MRKFLIAAAASLLLFGGQAQASIVESLDEPNVEVQEQSKWAHFRDKHLLGRETENERRDRKDWERRHPDRDYYRHRDRHRDDYYYRDRSRHRGDYIYYPPPPPPPPCRGYNYPPPPNR